MIASQYEGIMQVLGQILDRMPAAPVIDNRDPAPVGTPNRVKSAQVVALAVLRRVLDDWIKGAKENHDALGHRHENRGEECWRSFAPADIRTMINDAASELGLEPFPAPSQPEEDKQ